MPLTTIVPIATILLLALIAADDWRSRRIKHILTLPGTVSAIALSAYLPARFWLNALVGSLVAFLLFCTIRQLAHRHYGRDAFGFGDVMLAMLIGAIGGISGLFWLAIGMLLAGAYAAWLKWQKATETHIAYGTFLAIAAIGGLVVKDLFVL